MFTSGCDPEMFLKKGNKYIISQGIIRGTKENPFPLKRGGNIQRDNALVEFAIDPATSKLDYVQKIKNAFLDVKSMLPKGVDIDLIPSTHFDETELKHPECFEFGCSIDYNAWTEDANEFDEDAPATTLRSAGGHEHIGYVKGSGNKFLLTWEGQVMTVKVLDCVQGLMSVILDNNPAAIERRKLYGKPGCFRPTDYGVEYRTLSNFWLRSPKLVELMHMTTKECLDIVRYSKEFSIAQDIIEEIGEETIQNIILEGNVDLADKYLNEIIYHYLEDETWDLFKECEQNINNFKLEKEWEI